MPYGVDVVEPIRIEAGMVVTDYDYEAHERSPYDLGLDRVVALDAEGAFMGKEILRGIASRPAEPLQDPPARGDELPEYGAAVTKDGEDVGVLTSPANSPPFGPIGLAILRTDVASEGTTVDVALGDGTIGATVDVLAVLDPQKQRVRADLRRSRRLDRVSAVVGVVPNFSEGRRRDAIDAIVEALAVDGARVVFAEPDADHHRLDTTVLGDEDAVRRSALAGRPWPSSGSTCSPTEGVIRGWARWT